MAAAPAARASASSFASVYAGASVEYGVPADVLRAVAKAQTAEHAVTDSESGQHGLMGLTDATIAKVAPHLGLAPETVANDTHANVRAAAWILADARARGLNWNGAALEVAGFENPALRTSFVLKLNRVFESAGTTLEAAVPEDAVAQMAGTADYEPASWVPAYSGNYTSSTRTHTDLYYVVIHDIEGSYESAISWFQNPSANVSAHFVMSGQGASTQMVKIADIAWHAGNWDYNQHSVGIEHEGYASDPNSYTEAMYVASAALTRWLSDTYVISRDRAHILGHVEVPGATHTDPGPYWDWDHYMELVNNGTLATAKLVGYVRVGDINTGAAIAGATVTLDDGTTATTDADGYYEIDALALGTYTVTASAAGFENAVDSKSVDAATTYWKSLALAPVSTDPGVDPATNGGSSHKGCDVGFDGGNWAGSALALGALVMLALRRRTA